MANREVSYIAKLNIADIERKARQFSSVWEKQLKRIKIIDPGDTRRAAKELGRVGTEIRDIETAFRRVNQQSGQFGKNLSGIKAPSIKGLGDITGLLGGGVAGFSAVEIGKATLAAGEQGALNLRLARSYEQLAQGAGLYGDVLLGRLKSATRETVASQRLMESTNLLLAASQDGQIKITEDQIATLAKFARLRATQLTANGRPLSTENAFNRLITGTVKRETELLDELGISTKQLADQLGVPIKEVNTDVESLLTAITQVAEIEVARFGDPVLDEAEKIEAAQARIQESKDRINETLAQPVSVVFDVGADFIERATFSTTVERLENLKSVQGAIIEIEQQIGSLNNRVNNPDFLDSTLGLGDNEKNQQRLSDLQTFLERYRVVAEDAALATAAGVPGADELADALRQLGFDVESSRDSMEGAEIALTVLEDRLREAAKAAPEFAGENLYLGESLDLTTDDIIAQTAALRDLNAELGTTSRVAAEYNLDFGPTPIGARDFQSESQARFDARLDIIKEETEQNKENRKADARQQSEFLREQERLAKQSASAQERALKSITDDFKTALKNSGLFDTSDVTQEDLDLAELGLYQEKPDEFLRQLRGIPNGEDLFPDMTTGEALDKAKAALERINADVGDGSVEAIIASIERAWGDSSLFSDEQNLELINKDAVEKELSNLELAKKGEENLFKLFGIDPNSDLAIGSTIQADIQNSDVDVALTDKLNTGVANANVGTAAGAGAGLDGTAAISTEISLTAANITFTPEFNESLTTSITQRFETIDVDLAAPLFGKIAAQLSDEDKLNELGTEGIFIADAVVGGYLGRINDGYETVDLAGPLFGKIATQLGDEDKLKTLGVEGLFIADAVVGGYLGRMNEGYEGVDFMAPFVRAIQSSAQSEVVSTTLIGVGKDIFGYLVTGYQSAASEVGSNDDVGNATVDAFANSVMNAIADEVEATQ